ncbi:hypothetical protein Mic7113_5226 [Allocoleopsis franciscana PCC 7113]|uniref:Uncharacterized protein n=1 Tax=Allocoleopsis franciscana PCC 7113 TaxID=1173027 RepID=K9WM37_9CYAN|nr:hypothetical protein Mic7113_5226 [Allocoleopsis franciscana PCC 7113]
MPSIILILLLLLVGLMFTEVLVFFPLEIVNSFRPLTSLSLVVVLLVFLWCFGGD